MSDNSENKLKENVLLILYSVSENASSVNNNTLRRYVYLYYFTSAFLNDNTEDCGINVIVEKGDLKIIGLDSVLSYFIAEGFIKRHDNTVLFEDSLKEFTEKLLENKEGSFFRKYLRIRPFISVLLSYSDQFIFTIFFNEPTLSSAIERGLEKVHSTDSKLNKLLSKFMQKVCDNQIDEYDVLAFWMEYVLKHYYTLNGENSAD